MEQHAFAIGAPVEEGVVLALDYVRRKLKMETKANPNVVVLRHGLLSVEEARRVGEVAAQTSATGSQKVVIIAAARAYHEAQNALLKVFEEPPPGTYLFLILPALGGLLPTLRSRLEILDSPHVVHDQSDVVGEFMHLNTEKRSAYIKKLATGGDEEERRERRDTALALVNGIEATAYASGVEKHRALLNDLAILRGYLYDRSAPVRMILEHLSLVLPKDLV